MTYVVARSRCRAMVFSQRSGMSPTVRLASAATARPRAESASFAVSLSEASAVAGAVDVDAFAGAVGGEDVASTAPAAVDALEDVPSPLAFFYRS